jgi:demethylmenaquinone methyltransferase/2-methoxy-6-polyprenyl-1,4-benzoquinol methylase
MSTPKAGKLDIHRKKKASWKIFDQIAPTYDRINKVLSMGIDILWRKNFTRYLPQQRNLMCLDLATGTADVALELAKDERVKHIEATDLSAKMLEFGQKKVSASQYAHKITLHNADGVKIPSPRTSMDVITVAFGIRNFNDYKLSLSNMVRVLKPGGRAMILEFSLPKNSAIKSIYLFYFRSILPTIGNVLSGHSNAYTYLNKTVEDFPYGDAFISEMTSAGFSSVESKSLSFGIATLYIGHKS